MPTLRLVSELDAPPSVVAGVLRDVEAITEALAIDGHRVVAPARLVAAGDELRFSARLWLGARLRLRAVVSAVSAAGMESRVVDGLLRSMEHSVRLAPSGGGTTMSDELRWSGLLGVAAPMLRIFGRRAQLGRVAVVRRRLSRLEATPTRVVVATALVHEGRVLAAQRAEPESCAGRWELPGGTVEPGESEPAAVVRECREELGTAVVPGGRIGTDLPIAVGVLRVHAATLAPGAPDPRPLEHAALRWLGPDELDDVAWLDGDRAALYDLGPLLAAASPPPG